MQIEQDQIRCSTGNPFGPYTVCLPLDAIQLLKEDGQIEIMSDESVEKFSVHVTDSQGNIMETSNKKAKTQKEDTETLKITFKLPTRLMQFTVNDSELQKEFCQISNVIKDVFPDSLAFHLTPAKEEGIFWTNKILAYIKFPKGGLPQQDPFQDWEPLKYISTTVKGDHPIFANMHDDIIAQAQIKKCCFRMECRTSETGRCIARDEAFKKAGVPFRHAVEYQSRLNEKAEKAKKSMEAMMDKRRRLQEIKRGNICSMWLKGQVKQTTTKPQHNSNQPSNQPTHPRSARGTLSRVVLDTEETNQPTRFCAHPPTQNTQVGYATGDNAARTKIMWSRTSKQSTNRMLCLFLALCIYALHKRKQIKTDSKLKIINDDMNHTIVHININLTRIIHKRTFFRFINPLNILLWWELLKEYDG